MGHAIQSCLCISKVNWMAVSFVYVLFFKFVIWSYLLTRRYIVL